MLSRGVALWPAVAAGAAVANGALTIYSIDSASYGSSILYYYGTPFVGPLLIAHITDAIVLMMQRSARGRI